jgi:hypothetical protein
MNVTHVPTTDTPGPAFLLRYSGAEGEEAGRSVTSGH